MPGIFDAPEMQVKSARANPFDAPEMQVKQEEKEPSTTWGGAATALARGLAPVAAGAGIGAGIGALGGPIGAATGAGLVGGAGLGAEAWNALANLTGIPWKSYTAQDITDKLVDLLGGKPKSEQSLFERILESTASGASSAAGMGKLGETVAKSTLPSVFRGAGAKMAEKPAVSAISGALGGAGSQATGEYVSDNPLMQLLGGLAAGGAVPAAAERMSKPIGALTDRLGLPTPQFVTDHAARQTGKTENKARKILSNKFNTGVAGGAPGVTDLLESIEEARKEGLKYTLLDTKNPELRGQIGTVERQGGVSRSSMRSFAGERNKEQKKRLVDLIGRRFTKESALQTSDALKAQRSREGKYYWGKVYEQGTIPEPEQQYRSAYIRTTERLQQAQAQIDQANQDIAESAKAAAPLQRPGLIMVNEHTRRLHEAEVSLKEGIDEANIAGSDLRTIYEQLKTLGHNPEDTTPGAVWSPRLARLKDNPRVRAGLQKGYVIERDEADAEGRPINATDYALNKDGELINVPNMKTWVVAKTGMDSLLNTAEMRDPITGDLTKEGIAVKKVRDAVVEELDAINPHYKPARNAWSGNTNMMQAVKDGYDAFNRGKFRTEELKQHFNDLEDASKQAFMIGAMNDLVEKILAGNTIDKTKVIGDNVKYRLLQMLGDNENLQKFLAQIDREVETRQAPEAIWGNSQSMARFTEDQRNTAGPYLGAAADTAAAVAHAGAHSPLYAFGSLARGARRLLSRKRPNMPLNEAQIRLVIDPNIDHLIRQGSLAQGKGNKLFPMEPLPSSLTRQFIPGALIGTGVSFNNEPPPDLGFSWGAPPPSR